MDFLTKSTYQVIPLTRTVVEDHAMNQTEKFEMTLLLEIHKVALTPELFTQGMKG